MKLTTPEKQAIVRALRAGKKHLASSLEEERQTNYRKDEFVCNAIHKACKAGKITETASQLARDYIEDLLDGHDTFTGWLRVKHPKLSGSIEHDRHKNSGRQAQATRKAWINSMIKELA